MNSHKFHYEINATLQKADLQFAENDLDSAFATYSDVMILNTKYPTINIPHARAHIGRANIFMKENKPDTALRAYKQALVIDPSFSQEGADCFKVASLGCAQAYLIKGDINNTTRYCIDALVIDPLCEQSRTFFYNDIDKSNPLYDFAELLIQNPACEEAYLSCAKFYLEEKKFKKLQFCCKKVLAINPACPDAHLLSGDAYVIQQKFNEAVSEYTKALLLGGDARAYYSRGTAYYGKEMFFEAISDYTEAIGRDPGNTQIYCDRGTVHHRQQEFGKAIDDYTAAIYRDSGNIMAYNNRGASYYQQGWYSKAIADFTSAIHKDPGNIMAYQNRGTIYYELGQFEEAILDYSKLLELSTEKAMDYARRGAIYLAQGAHCNAIADFNRVLAADPDSELSKKINDELKKLYLLEGQINYFKRNYGEAAFYLQSALKIDPSCKAAQVDLDEIIYLLAQEGIEVNKSNSQGFTPLLGACRNRDIETIQKLLAHKEIDINKGHSNGVTPLYLACMMGYESIVNLLLKSDLIHVDSIGLEQYTPLLIACFSPHTYEKNELFRVLLQNKANIFHKNEKGEMAFDIAFLKQNNAAIEELFLHAKKENLSLISLMSSETRDKARDWVPDKLSVHFGDSFFASNNTSLDLKKFIDRELAPQTLSCSKQKLR